MRSTAPRAPLVGGPRRHRGRAEDSAGDRPEGTAGRADAATCRPARRLGFIRSSGLSGSRPAQKAPIRKCPVRKVPGPEGACPFPGPFRPSDRWMARRCVVPLQDRGRALSSDATRRGWRGMAPLRVPGTVRARWRPRALAVAIAAAGLLGASEPATGAPLTWPAGDGWLLTLEPDRREVYPRYLADPRRPRMAVGLLFAGESQVPATVTAASRSISARVRRWWGWSGRRGAGAGASTRKPASSASSIASRASTRSGGVGGTPCTPASTSTVHGARASASATSPPTSGTNWCCAPGASGSTTPARTRSSASPGSGRC